VNRSYPSSDAVAIHPVVGILTVDVLDRHGFGRRIRVRVEGAAPMVDAVPPVIARVRLAGDLTMHAHPWPRPRPGREVEYRGFRGRTYEPLPAPVVSAPGQAQPDAALLLMDAAADLLGLRTRTGYAHATTGRTVVVDDAAAPEPWEEGLAARYDLTLAEPVVAAYLEAVRTTVLVAGGVPLKASPLPRWHANVHAHQIALETRPWATNHLRNADVFGMNGLDAAKRFVAAMGTGADVPEVMGEIGFVDPAYLAADDLPSLCRVLAPWVANRWARHLADLPASLVRHCHDAANYSDERFREHEDRVRLLSALAEMMVLSKPLPDVRRGEWPEQAVQALLVRLHEAEGIPRYAGDGRPPAPSATG
jgi:hypothetical protein